MIKKTSLPSAISAIFVSSHDARLSTGGAGNRCHLLHLSCIRAIGTLPVDSVVCDSGWWEQGIGNTHRQSVTLPYLSLILIKTVSEGNETVRRLYITKRNGRYTAGMVRLLYNIAGTMAKLSFIGVMFQEIILKSVYSVIVL